MEIASHQGTSTNLVNVRLGGKVSIYPTMIGGYKHGSYGIVFSAELSMHPKVSVIICTYTEERWGLLIKAIESVQQQIMPVKEIIVVIDYNPRLYERLQQWNSKIILLENQEKKGLSGARNTGVAASTGDMIAFLDDDAIAAPDWLSTMSTNCGEKILGVGAAVLPVWESQKPAWFPEEFYWTVGCAYRGLPETPKPIRNLMGGAMCIRKEIFTEVGNFQNRLGRLGTLPLGCEETELCIRARQHWPQSNFIYEPRTFVYHHIPDRRAHFAYFRSRCYSEGISKAMVVELVGGSDGLSSEREYTFKTLPKGILKGLADALHGDFSGLGRAGAIILGLGFTALGYIVGTFKRSAIRNQNRAEAPTPTSLDS
jgi:glycosyltransferase involved in cell wall biosynthesis